MQMPQMSAAIGQLVAKWIFSSSDRSDDAGNGRIGHEPGRLH